MGHPFMGQVMGHPFMGQVMGHPFMGQVMGHPFMGQGSARCGTSTCCGAPTTRSSADDVRKWMRASPARMPCD